MAAQTQSCLLGPAPSELNRPIHWEPHKPFLSGSLRCTAPGRQAWLPAPRPAGGCGQQVGNEGGKAGMAKGGPRHAFGLELCLGITVSAHALWSSWGNRRGLHGCVPRPGSREHVLQACGLQGKPDPVVVQTRADFLVRTLRCPWVVHKPCPGKVGMGVQPSGVERGSWSLSSFSSSSIQRQIFMRSGNAGTGWSLSDEVLRLSPFTADQEG